MDWIERFTGLAPDRGGGGFELQILVIAGIVVALLIGVVRRLRA